MMLRFASAAIGAVLGGGVPLAIESLVGLPVSTQIAVSAVTGTIGALGALYAFAVPRRECQLTHHNVNNKIGAAALRAEKADLAVHTLRAEFQEFRGEMRAAVKVIDRIAEKVGAAD